MVLWMNIVIKTVIERIPRRGRRPVYTVTRQPPVVILSLKLFQQLYLTRMINIMLGYTGNDRCIVNLAPHRSFPDIGR